MMTKLLWLVSLLSTCWVFIPVREFFSGLAPRTGLICITVPSTTQFLVLSPFIPKYTIHNSYMNASTTVTVKNYDAKSVQKSIPADTPAYVERVTINGKPTASRCHFDFYDAFRLGGEVVIELTADKDSADDCAGPLPESISTGGFSIVR
jgi:Glycosyl hydrolase family 92